MKIVVDTNILVSSIFWSGSPYRIIQEGITQKHLIFSSEDILLELKKVLRGDFDIHEPEIGEIINAFVLFLHIVKPEEKVNAVQEDPKDNIILECALAANAEYIISGDRHLLRLKEFEGIKIVSAREFLDIADR